MGENPDEFNKAQSQWIFCFQKRSLIILHMRLICNQKKKNTEHFFHGKRIFQKYLINHIVSYEDAGILRKRFGWHLETDFHVF